MEFIPDIQSLHRMNPADIHAPRTSPLLSWQQQVDFHGPDRNVCDVCSEALAYMMILVKSHCPSKSYFCLFSQKKKRPILNELTEDEPRDFGDPLTFPPGPTSSWFLYGFEEFGFDGLPAEFGAHIHAALRMSCNNSDDPLTLPLPSLDQSLDLSRTMVMTKN